MQYGEEGKYKPCTHSGGDPAGGHEDADHDDEEEEEDGRRHRRRRRARPLAPPPVRDHSCGRRRSHGSPSGDSSPVHGFVVSGDQTPINTPMIMGSASGSGKELGMRRQTRQQLEAVASAPIAQEARPRVLCSEEWCHA